MNGEKMQFSRREPEVIRGVGGSYEQWYDKIFFNCPVIYIFSKDVL